MAFTLGKQSHVGPDINQYFHTAMLYDIDRLRAVMEGKDNSLPQSVAMMALQFKKPMIDAAKEGLKQPPAPSVKNQLLAESAPQQAMPAQGTPQQGGGQLPENSGIGQLPAPNLQGMGHAGGGIIAFDDGGSVDEASDQVKKMYERIRQTPDEAGVKYWTDRLKNEKLSAQDFGAQFIGGMPAITKAEERAGFGAGGQYGTYNGMPMLYAPEVDRVMDREQRVTGDLVNKDNAIGWDPASMSGELSRGAAAAGVYRTPMGGGMQGGSQFAGDLLGTAKQYGLDPEQYMKSSVGQYGQANPKQLDENALYGALNDKMKDYYAVQGYVPPAGTANSAFNRTDIGGDHARVMYQRVGDRLVPMEESLQYSDKQRAPKYSWTDYIAPAAIIAAPYLAPYLSAEALMSMGKGAVAGAVKNAVRGKDPISGGVEGGIASFIPSPFAKGGAVPRFKEKGFIEGAIDSATQKWSDFINPIRDVANVVGGTSESANAQYQLQQKQQALLDQLGKLQDALGASGSVSGYQQQDPALVAEYNRVQAELRALQSQQARPSPAAAPAAAAAPVEPMARDYTGLGMAGTIPKPSADKKESAVKKDRGSKQDNDVGIGNLKAPTVERRAGLDDLQTLTNKVEGTSGLAALTKGQKDLEDLQAAAQVRETKDFATRPKHTPYKEYERSLLEEKEQAKFDKEEAFNMALVNAGLAIMGGKSQYAMQNIAEGALAGTKQYTEATKDLKKAAKERNKELSIIEEARAAYNEKDFDRYQSLLAKHETAKIASKSHSIDAIQKLTGESAKIASEILRTQDTNVSNEYQQLIQAQSAANAAEIHGRYGVRSAGVYAGARGASNNPADIATDNAEKAYQNWLAGPGQFAKPEAAAAERRRLYQEAFRMQKLPDPFAGGGGGGGSPGVNGQTKSGATTSGW